jgi:hypothetical protein
LFENIDDVEHTFGNTELGHLFGEAGEPISEAPAAADPAVGLPGGLTLSEERYEELRRAEGDLRWLLRRIGKGPAGLLTRRFGGYKKLVERHLG